MLNKQSKNPFIFSKKDRMGILVLLFVIVAIFISAKYIYPLIIKDEPVSIADITTATDSLLVKQEDDNKKSNAYSNYNADEGYQAYSKKSYNNTFTGTMFYFDPNTLDAAGWQRLGIKDKKIASMQKYLSKGGRFKEPDDLRKVWGLRDDEKERLIPYVRIAAVAEQKYTNN